MKHMFKKLAKHATVALVLICASSVSVSGDHGKELSVLPFDLSVDEQNGKVSVKDDKVNIVARKGTDLFTSTTGEKSTDNTPRLLFEPKGDFVFSAKVSTSFNAAYDGGALVVYADAKRWGKLLFERFKSGKNGVATTVTDNTGDDAYHGAREETTQYLKIARHGISYVFYSSGDGKEWVFLRHFSLNTQDPVKVGFAAQAPLSDSLEVIFSDIKFKNEGFTNFWQGE